MEPLFLILAGVVATFWLGYQGAKRFPLLGSLVAILLLVGAGALIRLDLRPSGLGDGAPSSAGAFLGLLLLLEAACILLSGTLLVAGWRARQHLLSRALFLFLFLPFAAYAIFQVVPVAPQGTSIKTGRTESELSGTKKDGYVWALDSSFLAESECRGATPEFVAGCKDGVARNRARQAP
ncbi:MAG: hypothetical protein JSS42_12505 [Proteobacteria bacterium]|uniref:hypothetical protein n=1 Tax=Rudaea sp. TaxID=2136325 RepID=UPI0032209DB3|nr:hypothetical protein [Pseudomonadota bacterium]